MDRYVTPEEFDDYARAAREKGFAMVSSSPLTRSSYHADEDFQQLVAARERALRARARGQEPHEAIANPIESAITDP